MFEVVVTHAVVLDAIRSDAANTSTERFASAENVDRVTWPEQGVLLVLVCYVIELG
ncbi:MAG: hypothetical protein AAF297_07065 [Planctomycetota bacterium]